MVEENIVKDGIVENEVNDESSKVDSSEPVQDKAVSDELKNDNSKVESSEPEEEKIEMSKEDVAKIMNSKGKGVNMYKRKKKCPHCHCYVLNDDTVCCKCLHELPVPENKGMGEIRDML